MKTITLLIVSILLTNFLYPQVGIGTTTPDPSASLEISSSNAGLLIPRLSETQKTGITNPANGLLVFNSDSNNFEYNVGSSSSPLWTSLKNNISIFKDVKGYVSASGTFSINSGATLTKTGTGIYLVTFSNPAPNNLYTVIASPDRATGTDDLFLGVSNRTTNSFEIRISDEDDGGTTNNYIDNAFSFHVTFFDSGNTIQTAAAEYAYVTASTSTFAGNGVVVTRNAVGYFTVTFNNPKTNTNYVVNASTDRALGQDDTFIGIANRTLTSFDIYISSEDNGTATDTYVDYNFSFVVF